MRTSSTAAWVTGITWAARVLALLVFLLWGAFFVEHLIEWFIKPHPETPPPTVWFGQGLHLLLLVGLLVVLRWPRLGAAIVITSALAFFPRAGNHYALFTILTSIPALLLVACWYLSAKTIREGI